MAFSFPYFTGDGCSRDKDGYYWLTGRVDDVINVSGRRIGTAEVESTLASHPQCADAAVVGVEHEAQDIMDLGSLKEAAKIFIPGGASLYSARTIKIKEDEGYSPYRMYYFCEFGRDEQHVALVAMAERVQVG